MDYIQRVGLFNQQLALLISEAEQLGVPFAILAPEFKADEGGVAVNARVDLSKVESDIELKTKMSVLIASEIFESMSGDEDFRKHVEGRCVKWLLSQVASKLAKNMEGENGI